MGREARKALERWPSAVVLLSCEIRLDHNERPPTVRLRKAGLKRRVNGCLGLRFEASGLTSFATKLQLSDVETCYKMIRRKMIEQILPSLCEERFGIEIELTAKLAKLPGVRFREVAISYDKRTIAEGKKIGVRDGLRALWCIAKYA